MFCPACGVDLREPVVILRGYENTRTTFSCRCGIDWVINVEGFSIEATIRNLARLEAHTLALQMSLMFGPDFRTPAALDRVRAQE